MEEEQKETKELKKERKTQVNSHLANKQEVKQLVWVDRFRHVCFFSPFFFSFLKATTSKKQFEHDRVIL